MTSTPVREQKVKVIPPLEGLPLLFDLIDKDVRESGGLKSNTRSKVKKILKENPDLAEKRLDGDEYGTTILCHASLQNCHKLVEDLLKQFHCDVSTSGRTMLFHFFSPATVNL